MSWAGVLTGDRDHSKWFRVYAVQLRDYRLDTGTGPVYTLTASATDLAGNAVTRAAPRDPGN